MTQVEIRTADPAHAPFLNEMLELSAKGAHGTLPDQSDPGYAEFWRTYQTYRNQLATGQGATIVAVANGAPVGGAWYRSFSEEQPGLAYRRANVPELTIAVLQDFQGQGIGRLLMQGLIDRAQAEGMAGLTLNVEADNLAAQALYRSLKFKVFRTEADGSFSMYLALGNE